MGSLASSIFMDTCKMITATKWIIFSPLLVLVSSYEKSFDGFNVDPVSVWNGVLKPDGVAGTITGNFLGWLTSSIGLLLLSAFFYQPPGVIGRRKSVFRADDIGSEDLDLERVFSSIGSSQYDNSQYSKPSHGSLFVK